MKKLFRFRSLLSKEDEAEEDTNGRNKEKLSRRTASSMRLQTVSGKTELSEGINDLARQGAGKVQAGKASQAKQNGTTDDEEREGVDEDFNLRNLPQQSRGEQVAAGWPEWLTIAAGEALKGWIPKRADSFQKIDKIGQGTYSNVYKARDIETGKVVALKKVRCDSLEPQSVRFMAREIKILRRLDHPNVVQLMGLVISRMSSSLYLVFEYMDNDLIGLMTSREISFDEAQVKCFLLQILGGLDHCHSRGVLHRDLKGSNLLLDSGGHLKIADFGLGTFFKPDKKQQLTSRVVTLWYRPPELLLGAKEYGFGVDLWSVGCILAELFTGRPLMAGKTEVEQLHKIFKLCGSPSEDYWQKYNFPHAGIFKPKRPYECSMAETFKSIPHTAVDLLTVLLSMDPELRGSVSGALKSEFFTTKPFACDPSSLPKSSPSKDQIVETKGPRKISARRKAHRSDVSRRDGHGEKPKKGSAFQEANDDSVSSIEKARRETKPSTKKSWERSHIPVQEPAIALPAQVQEPAIVLPAQVQMDMKGVDGNPNNGPFRDLADTYFKSQANRTKENVVTSVSPRVMPRSGRHDLKFQGISGNHQQTADLSMLSSLVAARNNGSHDSRKDLVGPRPQVNEHYGYMKRREELQPQIRRIKHLQAIPLDAAEDSKEEAFHSGDISISQLRTAKSHYSGEGNIHLLKA